MVKSYSDDIEKDSYLKDISQLLDIPMNIIYDAYKKHKNPKQLPTESDTLKSEVFSQEDILI